MATGKRYYWIKLKDSFMNSEVVDFLMSQPNGANYVVLYQMLCLKTINTGGRLTCQIGDVIIPFDMGKIQRDCKWFSLDTIRIALGLYKQLGLIYEEQDGTLVLVNHAEMVGSETDYAEKNRRMRSNAANKRLQAGQYSGHESGHNVSADCGENVPIDIRDKRKDIRDIENAFHTMRSMLLPVLYLLTGRVPKADVYHAISTGYGGLLACMGGSLNHAPVLLTEHGIYTREREEEIIRAEWVVPSFKSRWI